MRLPVYFESRVSVYQGDALSVLREMPDKSVHCVVTSPPYWRLRDYGVEGQIGLEATSQEFIAKLVEIFSEVRRVLRNDGTCWVNMGDSYANDGKWGGQTGGKHAAGLHGQPIGRGKRQTGLKPKDLCGIPWRLAFALQDAGWYLRQDIIWAKPNPMPESVRDRCTKAHEYIFLLSKRSKYYYDHKAIMEECTETSVVRLSQNLAMQHGSERAVGKVNGPMKAVGGWAAGPGDHSAIGHARVGKEGVNSRFHQDRDPAHSGERKYRRAGNKAHKFVTENQRRDDNFHRTGGGLLDIAQTAYPKRNKRSVWEIATQGYEDAHFATYPEKLVEPCILAGCPAGGIVLDPFGGSMTTMAVARRLQCHGIAIELKQEYIDLGLKRLTQGALDFTEVPA